MKKNSNTTSLAIKYRPQTFLEVAGQNFTKRILSRAVQYGPIAPAYLFSGTRGVGKTSLARIMAKAINCEKSPAPEPCNECRFCKMITAGISPDVVEIDAATHGNVEEARRLKEEVSYCPLECRYKIFIIDEAHMLSKAAFNALLKTLEEPPGRVTFILATTEAHKFPATIISRCQHFVFKHLGIPELEEHLASVLDREKIVFEPEAVRLLARRGAGSVRDSMSLLSQVLSLGEKKLTEKDVRDVLGLAGGEIFLNLMQTLYERDLAGLMNVISSILGRGLDLGFFLREFILFWRNMFIVGQAGKEAASIVELSLEDTEALSQWSEKLGPAYIHAAWQMTLDSGKKIMTSLEPAQALELLLLNLFHLPNLIPLSFVPVMKTTASSSSTSTKMEDANLETAPDKQTKKSEAQPQTDFHPGQNNSQSLISEDTAEKFFFTEPPFTPAENGYFNYDEMPFDEMPVVENQSEDVETLSSYSDSFAEDEEDDSEDITLGVQEMDEAKVPPLSSDSSASDRERSIGNLWRKILKEAQDSRTPGYQAVKDAKFTDNSLEIICYTPRAANGFREKKLPEVEKTFKEHLKFEILITVLPEAETPQKPSFTAKDKKSLLSKKKEAVLKEPLAQLTLGTFGIDPQQVEIQEINLLKNKAEDSSEGS